MKEFYICDCARVENQTITSLFVVAVKQVKAKKSGEPYLSVTLADRSGQLQAHMWDNVAETLNAFDQDDFVKVKGMVHKYNGRWQLTIHKLRKLQEGEIEYSDYLPTTTKNIDQLWSTLAGFVESFENIWLKTLLKTFLDDEKIATAYKNAPAAKTLHHAFVGGLLDHVVSLFTVCDLAARNYPQINRDLLLTGAFLHDIGKLHELAYQRSIAYTTEGQLLGHMIIELEMLHKKLALLPGFPDELKILIEHMIISHHGQYEFGSPKLPMFPEALMLHYMDDLDSKLESMRAQFEREAELETAWTSYNPSLGRPLLNSRKFIERGWKASRLVEPVKSPPVKGATESGEDVPEPAAASHNVADGQVVDSVESHTVGASDSSLPEAAPENGPQSANSGPNPGAAGEEAAAPDGESKQASLALEPEASLEALGRKFASHRVTPVGSK
jgi:3'-5' exoribonuclease